MSYLNKDWALEVEIPCNWVYSSSNYLTHLEFKLDEDSGLDVLEVATHHASLGGRIDTYHDLRSQMSQKVTTTDAPSALLSLRRSGTLSPRAMKSRGL